MFGWEMPGWGMHGWEMLGWGMFGGEIPGWEVPRWSMIGLKMLGWEMPGRGCPGMDADTSSSRRMAHWCWVPPAGTSSRVSPSCWALPPVLAGPGVLTFEWAQQEEGTQGEAPCGCHHQWHWQPGVGASGCPVSTGTQAGVPQGSCTWWTWMPSSPASTASPCCGRSARGAQRRSCCPLTMMTRTGVSSGHGTAPPQELAHARAWQGSVVPVFLQGTRWLWASLTVTPKPKVSPGGHRATCGRGIWLLGTPGL